MALASFGHVSYNTLDGSTVGRPELTDSRRRFPSGDSVSGEILNMFNMENSQTLRRIGKRLWRIGRRLYYTHTHTPILEESALELALESTDYSSESAYSPRIGVWVRSFRALDGAPQCCMTILRNDDVAYHCRLFPQSHTLNIRNAHGTLSI